MDGFPSGQRGQTVNLLQIASVVRIHLHPLVLEKEQHSIISRGGAVWKLVGLITRRSQVQILSPQLFAQLAQLVEQRTENPRVSGSIPELGTICGCSSMVEHQPSKLDTWVRFPSPAQILQYSQYPICVCSSVGQSTGLLSRVSGVRIPSGTFFISYQFHMDHMK